MIGVECHASSWRLRLRVRLVQGVIHIRFDRMAPTLGESVSGFRIEAADGEAVVFVVVLRHRERPSSVDDVAAHELGFDPLRELGVVGCAKQICRFAEREVSPVGEAVKPVERAVGMFDGRRGFGKLSERGDGDSAHPVGVPVPAIGPVLVPAVPSSFLSCCWFSGGVEGLRAYGGLQHVASSAA